MAFIAMCSLEYIVEKMITYIQYSNLNDGCIQ